MPAPRYDICKSKRALAVLEGAVEVTERREFAAIIRRVREGWPVVDGRWSLMGDAFPLDLSGPPIDFAASKPAQQVPSTGIISASPAGGIPALRQFAEQLGGLGLRELPIRWLATARLPAPYQLCDLVRSELAVGLLFALAAALPVSDRLPGFAALWMHSPWVSVEHALIEAFVSEFVLDR